MNRLQGLLKIVSSKMDYPGIVVPLGGDMISGITFRMPVFVGNQRRATKTEWVSVPK